MSPQSPGEELPLQAELQRLRDRLALELAAELLRAKEQAILANSAKSAFLATVSHEIRRRAGAPDPVKPGAAYPAGGDPAVGGRRGR